MSRVLFVFPNIPISENAEGGGGLVMKNHLQLLHSYYDEVHLLLIGYGGEEDKFDRYFSASQESLRPLFVSKSSMFLKISPQGSRWDSYKTLLLDPKKYAFPFLNESNSDQFRQVIDRIKPDLIWAEHLTAALCAFYFGRPKFKILYAHHDWEHKLRALRDHDKKKLWGYRVRSWLVKRQELKLVRKVCGVVASSYSEYQECNALGARKAMYLALFIPPSAHGNSATRQMPFGLFHLGGMKTTANRVGLENFFKHCWPTLKKSIPNIKLTLIGSLDGASEFLRQCFKHPDIISMGYVSDADKLLTPGGIHIIPWNHNTGVRTKVPVAMRNMQVVVGMAEALRCFQEVEHNVNVMMASTYGEFTDHIVMLGKDPALVTRLSFNSYDTFQRHFTFDKQKAKFDVFMNSLNLK